MNRLSSRSGVVHVLWSLNTSLMRVSRVIQMGGLCGFIWADSVGGFSGNSEWKRAEFVSSSSSTRSSRSCHPYRALG